MERGNTPDGKKIYQVDHIVTCKSPLKCFKDTGITEPILDSDHKALRCKLRQACRLRKKSHLICLNYVKLDDEKTAEKFRTEVLHSSGESFSEISSAIQKASISILPKKERGRPGWFKEKEDIILPLIEVRNSAMAAVYQRRTQK